MTIYSVRPVTGGQSLMSRLSWGSRDTRDSPRSHMIRFSGDGDMSKHPPPAGGTLFSKEGKDTRDSPRSHMIRFPVTCLTVLINSVF